MGWRFRILLGAQFTHTSIKSMKPQLVETVPKPDLVPHQREGKGGKGRAGKGGKGREGKERRGREGKGRERKGRG